MTVVNKQQIEIEIDKLTNSIENAISGDSFKTEVHTLSTIDLSSIRKGNGWKFDWQYEYQQSDREVFKLTIKGNESIIQGLVSISDYEDHYFLNLIETAPFNYGKRKLYVGVPGNLVAFACKQSWDKGYEGFIAFTSKTKLIEHYEKTLGAVHVGDHKMIIFPESALRLINKYFKQ